MIRTSFPVAALFAFALLAVLLPGCDSSDRQQAQAKARAETDRLAARTKEAADGVASATGRAVQELQSDTRKAGEELKNSQVGADLRQAVKTSASEAERVLEDTAVTSRVKAALLADRNVFSSRISVDTSDGNVVLSGHLPDEDQVTRAVDIARRTDGVKKVENRLSAS